MINVCVICMVKRPPLSPLSAEHRTLLEAIVSPVMNTADLQAFHCQWLACDTCKVLMQTVYNFQQTALVGVKNLKYLLLNLKTGPTVNEETLPTVDIKVEPTAVVSTAASVDNFITIEAPGNDQDNLLTEELIVKFEPEPPDSEHEPEDEPDLDAESASHEPDRDTESASYEPDRDTVSGSHEPDRGTVSTNHEPDRGTVSAYHEPDRGTVSASHEPDRGAVSASHEPDRGTVSAYHEPDRDTVSASHEPDRGAVSASHEPDRGTVSASHEPDRGTASSGCPDPSPASATQPSTNPPPHTQVTVTQLVRVPNTQQRVPNIQPVRVPSIQPVRVPNIQPVRVPSIQPRVPNIQPVRVPNTQQVRIMPVIAVSEGKFEVYTHQPQQSLKPSNLSSIRSKDGVGEDQGPKKGKYKRKKPPRVSCPHCGKSIRDNCSLRVHITRLHGEISLVECDVCGKEFRNETALKYHKYNHRENKPNLIENPRPELFCKECCMQLPSPSAYRIHRSTLKHMPKEQYKFECETCKAKFLDKKRLQEHVNVVHLLQKEYKCDKCENSYGTSAVLRRHRVRVHEKRSGPPAICHLCGKTFTIRKSLKEHLLTHEGLRPHQCPLCPATFTYKAALYTHNRLKHLKIKGKWKKKKKVQKQEVKEDAGNYDADGVGELLKII